MKQATSSTPNRSKAANNSTKEKNPHVPGQKHSAHQQYIGQVEPNDLQAQVFVK